jgi:hypothetical protein
MSFEQPKPEQPPEIESEEGKETKETSGDLELEKENDFDRDFTPEETKEILETTEKEIRLRATLEKWTEETGTNLRQRAEHFGLGESVVNEIQKDIKESFQKDFYAVITQEGIEKLKEASSKTISNLTNKENKSGLQTLLEKLSKKDIIDLLNRKLEGEVAPEEKEMLDIFSYVEKGERLGVHDPTSGKIEISLLNSKNLEEYTCTLMHEFTHKALSGLVPETTKEEIKVGGMKALARSLGLEKKRGEMTANENAQDLFFQTLIAINESLAHRVEEYYGAKHEPQYAAYRNKTHPGLFEKVYAQIDAAATGRSLAEFDHFAAHIYSVFANKWRGNLSQEDLKKAVISVMEEINKFKK